MFIYNVNFIYAWKLQKQHSCRSLLWWGTFLWPAWIILEQRSGEQEHLKSESLLRILPIPRRPGHRTRPGGQHQHHFGKAPLLQLHAPDPSGRPLRGHFFPSCPHPVLPTQVHSLSCITNSHPSWSVLTKIQTCCHFFHLVLPLILYLNSATPQVSALSKVQFLRRLGFLSPPPPILFSKSSVFVFFPPVFCQYLREEWTSPIIIVSLLISFSSVSFCFMYWSYIKTIHGTQLRLLCLLAELTLCHYAMTLFISGNNLCPKLFFVRYEHNPTFLSSFQCPCI